MRAVGAEALAKLLPFQREDFIKLFRIMAGLPVTIRLLDPPLHEFLPPRGQRARRGRRGAGHVMSRRCAAGSPSSPRRTRCSAIAAAASASAIRRFTRLRPARSSRARSRSARETGNAPHPEIMIPLVGMKRELEITRAQVERVAKAVFEETGSSIEYSIGTMIELPRAAITADSIAEQADFFSFGTNDLTQTVFGLSRDDAGKFLPTYVEKGILPKDPFVSIDVQGVGAMVAIAVEKGRRAKPGLKVGICGEHGGDPASIAFCEEVGLDYVSCSPYRVPVARLAAAQASLGAAQSNGE